MNAKSTKRQQVLCGSYFEMVKKLDASNVNSLTTLDDFTKAMSVYNQTQVDEFCEKFPGFIPQDLIQYPESYKLFQYANKTCSSLCTDDTDIENIVVQPICRILAIGYKLSDTKAAVAYKSHDTKELVQEIHKPASNTTISQQQQQQQKPLPSANEGNQNSQNVQPKVTKSEATTESTKQGQEIPLAPSNDFEKEDGTDGLGEIAAKENLNVNVEPVAENKGNLEEESKPIAPINSVKEKQTPNNKPDENSVKPIAKITSSVSDNPTSNAETVEKYAINAQQPVQQNFDDDDDVDENDDKTKDVTDFNEIYPDSKLNGDDSSEKKSYDPVVEKSDGKQKQNEDQQIDQNEDPFTNDTDSNFFTYFMFLLFVCVIAYVVYHNKTKMLALMLEGRRSGTNGRSGLSRRKHTAAYRKLDSNLEEAITSSGNGRSTQVIY